MVPVSPVGSGSVCERVAREKSSNRRRRTTVRHDAPPLRSRRARRSTSPTRIASTASATWAAGRARTARRSSGGGRRPHAPWVAVVGERVQLAAGGAAEQRHELVLASRATCADGRDPVRVQLAGGDRADAPQPLDRQRMQERELGAGGTTSRPSGFATALATLARNLVGATPTVIGSPTSSSTRAAAARRSRAASRRSAACRGRRGTPRRSTAPRPAASCRGRRRTPPCSPPSTPPSAADHDRVRAQPPRPPPAHRRPHPARLRLVAGRQHHAAADDHRPAAQPRIVALLDRRVERVEVGVQDGGLSSHEHMFASPASDGSRPRTPRRTGGLRGMQPTRPSRRRLRRPSSSPAGRRGVPAACRGARGQPAVKLTIGEHAYRSRIAVRRGRLPSAREPRLPAWMLAPARVRGRDPRVVAARSRPPSRRPRRAVGTCSTSRTPGRRDARLPYRRVTTTRPRVTSSPLCGWGLRGVPAWYEPARNPRSSGTTEPNRERSVYIVEPPRGGPLRGAVSIRLPGRRIAARGPSCRGVRQRRVRRRDVNRRRRRADLGSRGRRRARFATAGPYALDMQPE